MWRRVVLWFVAFGVAFIEHLCVGIISIMAAVHIWGRVWANTNVCFFTDNEALAHVITNQTSREPHVMALLRPLVLACLSFNINFVARHIPGRCNVLADHLSRSQVEVFRELAPWANSRLVQVPHGIPRMLRESVSQMLNASLSTASRAHYGRAWHKLATFTIHCQ